MHLYKTVEQHHLYHDLTLQLHSLALLSLISLLHSLYTLNIANELFPHYYESPIYIAVDFSQKLRENYVINRLENSKRLNIHIEKSTSNKTDILISDMHDPNFDNEFIWKDDPDIIDWINLDEFIQSQHEENNI
ncbi:hypothetical protein WHE01_13300 [Weissella hellenica]|nr:hypothetical protein WHE01_13300 [Weissella hellenica]